MLPLPPKASWHMFVQSLTPLTCPCSCPHALCCCVLSFRAFCRFIPFLLRGICIQLFQSSTPELFTRSCCKYPASGGSCAEPHAVEDLCSSSRCCAQLPGPAVCRQVLRSKCITSHVIKCLGMSWLARRICMPLTHALDSLRTCGHRHAACALSWAHTEADSCCI